MSWQRKATATVSREIHSLSVPVNIAGIPRKRLAVMPASSPLRPGPGHNASRAALKSDFVADESYRIAFGDEHSAFCATS
jgi:hypothetical protein